MEPYFVDLIIYNEKIPKPIRDIIVVLLHVFISIFGIACGLYSKMLIGNIFGLALIGSSTIACLCIIRKIHKTK